MDVASVQNGKLELVHEHLTREACRRLVYFAVSAANLAAELGVEDPADFLRFQDADGVEFASILVEAHRAMG